MLKNKSKKQEPMNMGSRKGKNGRLYLSAARKKPGARLKAYWSQRRKLESYASEQLITVDSIKIEEPESSVEEYMETVINDIIIGERIVNVTFFLNSLRNLNSHGNYQCTLSDMIVISEIQRGFNLGLEFKCKVCLFQEVVWTKNPQLDPKSVNVATTCQSIRKGLSHLKEQYTSEKKIPESSYDIADDYITNVNEKTIDFEIMDATIQEKHLSMVSTEIGSNNMLQVKNVEETYLPEQSYSSEYLSLSKAIMSDYTYPNETPIKLLDCDKAFGGLTDKEKFYAHYLSKAAFYGGLIVLAQTSLESSLIFVLLHKLLKTQPLSALKQIALQKCNFTEDEFTAVVVYAAGFFSNMGNYKSFGDTKFIPNLTKEKFEALVLASRATELEPEKMQSLLVRCLEPMFSLEDSEKQLGFPHIGKTTYLSKNFTESDKEIIKNFFKEKGFEPTNTRLIKSVDETSGSCYEIRLASVLQTDDEEEKDLVYSHTVNGHKFVVTRGDYSKLLSLVNKYLTHAKEYAANENEIKMIENYIQSFHTGSIEGHKEGSRFWIKDKGPVIESYIGFIETYRDPAGMRAEFEGFVALVNKAQSVKFDNLVNAATEFLPLLPWPKEYEKDKFLRPDFTSLDILTFAGSGIPAGICIPNYDDVRQNEGFKNVSLGNVISSRTLKKANYLNKDDQELLEKYCNESFEVQVGLHELLGHGSGKLFQKNKDGTFNFNIDEVKHLETGEKLANYYDVGETYDSVFSSLGSAYEECRAECTGIYLSLELEVLKVFGHEGAKAQKVCHCNWLDMLHKGLESLKMYEPKTESWLQAHSQARYVILQVCLEAGEGFVNIERVKGADGNPDLLLTVDYTKIKTVGKQAIEKFLRKLQLYKATADISSAKAMFDKYSAVTSEDKYPFLDYREIVMARKKPRDIHVQANTIVENNKVHLLNYESSAEGLIQSWIDRFQDDSIEKILEEIWEKDKPYF